MLKDLFEIIGWISLKCCDVVIVSSSEVWIDGYGLRSIQLSLLRDL